tara:strand:+ start:138 stop:1703 length:1566 start_codon:yes stop_codon:yes gene_type:complete
MSRGFGENINKKLSNSNGIIFKKLIEKAFLAQKSNKISEAEVIYEELLRFNVREPSIYFNYGLLLESQKKINEAINVYITAINYFPNNPNFYNKLGLLKKIKGRYEESKNLFLKSIELEPNFEFGYVNLANLYLFLGKSTKAEQIYRKILSINPKSELGNLNLGILLMDKGDLEEAEKLFLKTIEINSKSTNAFFLLSKFKNINHNESFKKKLLNSELLIGQDEMGKVNIFFARSNINHLDKKYNESSRNLIMANSTKLKLIKSDVRKRINFPNFIFKQYSQLTVEKDNDSAKKNYIFIVGMPRSGSTLIESIISLNEDVFDLGESEGLPRSFNKWIQNNNKSSLLELYKNEINGHNIKNKNITDKNLSNYAYIPLILNKIKGARIIHSYRNPLDNILSVYRANFTNGFSYSSSLVDTAKVLKNERILMRNYKNLYSNHIFSLNYDQLVKSPEYEIRKLINWLNFEWNEKYLSPHLNLRKVFTTSKVQVRSAINSKSLNGWQNYKGLLEPVYEFFTKQDFS